MKYGGSSLGSLQAIERIADTLARWHAAGDGLVVVCSAMGSATDELLALARQTAPSGVGRELDMLITAGERIAAALLALRLGHIGTPARSFTGSQAGIVTDDSHGQARVLAIRPHRVRAALASGHVVIVAGFQGVSEAGDVTTLLRGGSDTTAVALAAALGAACCEIYSDVDGIYSADPAHVPDARPLPHLDAASMLAMAEGGARVLASEAVALAERAGIAIEAAHAHRPQGRRSHVAPSWRGGPATFAAIASADAWRLTAIPSGEGPVSSALGPALWPPQNEIASAAVLLYAAPGEAFVRAPVGELAAAPEHGQAATAKPVAVVTAVLRPGPRDETIARAAIALHADQVPARWLMADALRVLFVVRREDERAAVRSLHRALVGPRPAAGEGEGGQAGPSTHLADGARR